MLIFEDVTTTARRKLFTWLGVEWLATPWAWLSGPFFLGLGLACALAGASKGPLDARLRMGPGYGLLLFLSNGLHTVGHIVSGRMVRSPMQANLITATFHVNLYLGDPAAYPARVHIGRALGGPLFNLLIGFMGIAVLVVLPSAWLTFFALANLVVGLWLLIPLPGLDGEVIWGQLRRRNHHP